MNTDSVCPGTGTHSEGAVNAGPECAGGEGANNKEHRRRRVHDPLLLRPEEKLNLLIKTF